MSTDDAPIEHPVHEHTDREPARHPPPSESSSERTVAREPAAEGGAGRETGDDAGLRVLIDVAHDFRSPLTSILFLSEALRASRGQPLGPTQERQLMLIYSAAFELSALANDLTELGRGGRGLLERQPLAFSVNDVLTSVRDLVRPIAEEKGVEVRIACEPQSHRIGHPAALGRVLLNLTTNALRVTEQGFVEVGMEALDQERVRFHVRDTGPGLPADARHGLDAPLDARLVSKARRFSGTGLGLLICRRLLAAMGSELAMQCAGEHGTLFHFTLRMPAATRA